ncbi:hypothetical protein K474DRAFT_1591012 [Panus rudis PR-1116 ss-1]|nr:hypothetical protein K474DRAFT_1591012 [Panus rudis PR-1116 ss-1]
MPLAPVDDKGIALYYEDCGPPNGATPYTTLVVLHGPMYHGGIFSRMIPYAEQNNLRLILVNLRDYKNSTPYSAEELAKFSNFDKNVQAYVVREQGLQIAILLAHLIDTLNLPPLVVSSDNKTDGGISLLAWGFSIYLASALLAYASSFPATIREKIDRYLKSVVFYSLNAPTVAFSPNPPKGLHFPLYDQNIPFEQRKAAWERWLSSYFPPVHNLASVSLNALANRVALHDTEGVDVDPAKRPTIDKMTEEELRSVENDNVFENAALSLAQLDLSNLHSHVRRALGMKGETDDLTPSLIWPRCKIVLAWSDMAQVDTILASARLEKMILSSDCHRDGTIVKIEGANNFVHWDEPEKLVRVLAENI